MATRDEMGKALMAISAGVPESHWDNLAEQWRETYRVTAESFAAWLREQDGEQEYRRQFEERCGRWFDRALPDSMPMANSTPCPHCGGIAIHRATCPTRDPEFSIGTQQLGDTPSWGLTPGVRKLIPPSCPKGHVLTHPEDIEKRYCGVCREYIR